MSERLYDVVTELARWSRVAERNGDLHARLASALAVGDEDCSPAYQAEYQRLWHEAAARAKALQGEVAQLRLRLDVAEGLLDDEGLRKDYWHAVEEAEADARGQAMEP